MTPWLARLTTAVRLTLGLVLVVNGLNWWVKLVDPYPSISDFAAGQPLPPDFVGGMIATGFLFHIVKAIELGAGIALLANIWVPLALVAVLPVTLNVFFVDVLIAHHLRSFFNGAGSLAMTGFLMFAYLGHYAPMLAMRAAPDPAGPVAPRELPFLRARAGQALLTAFGAVSLALGLVIVAMLAGLIVQHFRH